MRQQDIVDPQKHLGDLINSYQFNWCCAFQSMRHIFLLILFRFYIVSCISLFAKYRFLRSLRVVLIDEGPVDAWASISAGDTQILPVLRSLPLSFTNLWEEGGLGGQDGLAQRKGWRQDPEIQENDCGDAWLPQPLCSCVRGTFWNFLMSPYRY